MCTFNKTVALHSLTHKQTHPLLLSFPPSIAVAQDVIVIAYVAKTPKYIGRTWELKNPGPQKRKRSEDQECSVSRKC